MNLPASGPCAEKKPIRLVYAYNDPGLRFIDNFPAIEGADVVDAIPKPEGMMKLNENDRHWELLLVCDGLKNGHALKLQVKKPRSP